MSGPRGFRDLVAAAAEIRDGLGTPFSELLIAGVGWATVELERASAELEAAGLDLGIAGWRPAERDALLGATALVRTPPPSLAAEPVGRLPVLVLLEPDTEGRLAAALARWGEGILAVYLAAGHAGGAGTVDATMPALGAPAPGPLGRARLLLGRPAWGPHVLVLDPEGAA